MAGGTQIPEYLEFECEGHKIDFLKNMKQFHDDNLLTDVVLRVRQRQFSCHRNVLACTSPYFRAMFTTDLTESKQQEIELFEIDADSLEAVIDYCYSGIVKITHRNAQNLLSAASLFQIGPILKACAQFMETQLDTSNCIGIHEFASIHNCVGLQNKAKEYIEKSFEQVSLGEEFVALCEEKLCEIISSNELNVENEEVVFEAVMRWVKHERDSRLEVLVHLLPLIRFGLIHAHYMQENVLSNDVISASARSLKMVADIHWYGGEHAFTGILRSGMIKPEFCFLMIGGVDNNKLAINCYNPLTRETYYMADFQEQCGSGYYDVEDPACVVTADNEIFVAGGNYIYHENYGECPSDDSFDDLDDESVRKDFYKYDNDHDCWLAMSPMLFPKSNFTVAAVDGKIFCFGGLTINQHPTEIIESYDIAVNRWSYVGMMPTTLVDLSAVVYAGQIYILGGRTGVGAHNVVLRYNTSNNEWTPLAGMPTPRFNFGACVVGDEIYVAGGQIYSHTSHTINREALNSVEIYNIAKNQWRQGCGLPQDMYNTALFLHCGHLYACGTNEHHRSAYIVCRFNVVYILDLARSVWKQVESDLCGRVRDYACVAAKMYTRKLSQVFRPAVDT